MNSSVKSLVPSVSVPPDPADDALVLLVELAAVLGDAPAADEAELELLLLPQAATNSAATIASIPGASIRSKRDVWRAVACLLICLFLLLVKRRRRANRPRRPRRLSVPGPVFVVASA